MPLVRLITHDINHSVADYERKLRDPSIAETPRRTVTAATAKSLG
jgi:hypothetical protein